MHPTPRNRNARPVSAWQRDLARWADMNPEPGPVDELAFLRRRVREQDETITAIIAALEQRGIVEVTMSGAILAVPS